MKLEIVISTGDLEVIWNAFRVGNFALKEEDSVTVFLLAKGGEFDLHSYLLMVVKRFLHAILV